MPKASPALLAALLLVTALAAPATVGGVTDPETRVASTSPSPGVSSNTTHVLQLDGIDASGFGEPRVVVLDALSAEEAELDQAYSLARLQNKLAAAPNSTARRQVIQNATDAAAADARALREQEREVREAFVEGDISAETYLQEMAVIHVRATHLISFLGNPGTTPSVYSLATSVDTRARAWALSEELQMLTGPVRERMAETVVGDAGPMRVHVAASDNGFAFAYLRPDRTYVRETFRSDNLDEDFLGGQNVTQLRSKVDDRYPGLRTIDGFHFQSATLSPAHGSAHVVLSHPHGRVRAYIDDTTSQVYYEIQYKQLRDTPVDYAINQTKNDTRVLVSKTYPGGPLQVKLLNATSENKTPRINIPVTVNGTTTERTDANGVTWFISPNGEYNVTTAYNGTEFRINVTA